jgi:hypothetical protein
MFPPTIALVKLGIKVVKDSWPNKHPKGILLSVNLFNGVACTRNQEVTGCHPPSTVVLFPLHPKLIDRHSQIKLSMLAQLKSKQVFLILSQWFL